MANMASGIACGRIMYDGGCDEGVAQHGGLHIANKKFTETLLDMQPWFILQFFDTEHPCYDRPFPLLLFRRKGTVIDTQSFWFRSGRGTKNQCVDV